MLQSGNLMTVPSVLDNHKGGPVPVHGLGIGMKRKEIYKYEAPWTVYGMNWSVRPDKRFRLALGSFVEEYSNKVGGRAYIVHVCLKLYTF